MCSFVCSGRHFQRHHEGRHCNKAGRARAAARFCICAGKHVAAVDRPRHVVERAYVRRTICSTSNSCMTHFLQVQAIRARTHERKRYWYGPWTSDHHACKWFVSFLRSSLVDDWWCTQCQIDSSPWSRTTPSPWNPSMKGAFVLFSSTRCLAFEICKSITRATYL